jgi:ribonuclease HII
MRGAEFIKAWRARAAILCPTLELPPHLGLSWEGVEYLRQYPPKLIIGADEVGYGSLAGPVTVCAFAARPGWTKDGLRDSKKLTTKCIAELSFSLTREKGVHYALCSIDNERIDKWGLQMARQVAFEVCLEELREKIGDDFNYSLVVLDGDVTVRHIDHISLPKADSIVPQVSAASVIAKFDRDSWMINVAHQKYPLYKFAEHVGYGTDEHRRILSQAGPCPLHRLSFKVKPFRPRVTSP